MNVKPLQMLKALVQLQEIDIRIRDLERDRQQIPARLAEIEDTLGAKRQERNVARNQLDEAEMSRRLAESDLRAEKEKVKKWEARLAELKNNRDYQALSREIEAARKANLGIEDEILRKMQEIEDLKTRINQLEDSLTDSEKELSAEKQVLEDKLRSMNAGIEQETGIRAQAVSKVDSGLYRQYQMIRNRRDGVAVVSVLDEHCQGCHMGIPPQLYIIVLRGEQIETCPYCHRIIYFKQAVEQASMDEEPANQG